MFFSPHSDIASQHDSVMHIALQETTKVHVLSIHHEKKALTH